MAKGKSFFEKLSGNLKLENLNSSPSQEKNSEEINLEEKSKKYSKESEIEGQLAIDVYQTEREIIIKSAIAGISPEDLDISITNDMVNIRGERMDEQSIDSQEYFYQECYWGSFSRAVILPEEIDADQSKAIMKNGILTILLPKASKAKSKKLKVELED